MLSARKEVTRRSRRSSSSLAAVLVGDRRPWALLAPCQEPETTRVISLRALRTRHAAAALAAAVWVACALAPAHAQDSGRPEITEIHDGMNRLTTKAPQGGVIIVVGQGFHECPPPPEGVPLTKHRCTHPGLEAKIAGQPVTVLASTGKAVTLMIPASARPTRSARVVLTTRAGSARANLEIVAAGAGPPPNGPVSDGAPTLSSLRITRFLRVREPTGSAFVVEGVAGLIPDGMEVQVSLQFNGQPLAQATKLAPIQGGRFKATFGPYAKPLVWGNYTADALFELGRQSKGLRRRWSKQLTAAERDAYGRVLRREFLPVGTADDGEVAADDLARQRKRLAEHVHAHCEALSDLFDALEAAVRDACERFKPSAYQEAVGVVLEQLVARHEADRAFNARTLLPIDRRADLLSEALVAILLEVVREHTRALYAHAKLAVPPELERVPIAPRMMLQKASAASRGEFDARRRELLRRLAAR